MPKSSEKKAGWVANIAPLPTAKASTMASRIRVGDSVLASQKNGKAKRTRNPAPHMYTGLLPMRSEIAP